MTRLLVTATLILALSAPAFAQGTQTFTTKQGNKSATLKRKLRENGTVRKEVLKTDVDGKHGRVVSKFDEQGKMISVKGSGSAIDKDHRGKVNCADDPGLCTATQNMNQMIRKRAQGQIPPTREVAQPASPSGQK